MEMAFFWTLITLSAIFVGMGKGGLPVVATLGVPSLSLIMSPVAAAGLLLPVYIVSDIFALSAYRRDFNREVLKIGIIGMSFGVIIGGMTAHIVVEWMVTALIGMMGFIFAVNQLFFKKSDNEIPQTINNNKGYFWCTIAGFTSFISHIGGPPWQIFTIPLQMKKTVFVGTSVIVFSYCNAIKLIPYMWLGQINIESVKISLFMMFPASLAVFAGIRIVKIIPEDVFFKIITWALMSISIKLMWDGFKIPFG